MDNLELDRAELEELTLLLNEVECVFDDLESSVTLLQSGVYAHKIPSRLRFAFNEFRLGQMSGVLRISGYPVDQERLGPTPSHWRGRPVPSTTRREELLLILQLESGDFCFLDNFRVVHGRKPFRARYDGTDRWLKCLNISCDLRKSRAARRPGSRAIRCVLPGASAMRTRAAGSARPAGTSRVTRLVRRLN